MEQATLEGIPEAKIEDVTDEALLAELKRRGLKVSLDDIRDEELKDELEARDYKVYRDTDTVYESVREALEEADSDELIDALASDYIVRHVNDRSDHEGVYYAMHAGKFGDVHPELREFICDVAGRVA